jgi:hypothetical protein
MSIGGGPIRGQSGRIHFHIQWLFYSNLWTVVYDNVVSPCRIRIGYDRRRLGRSQILLRDLRLRDELKSIYLYADIKTQLGYNCGYSLENCMSMRKINPIPS